MTMRITMLTTVMGEAGSLLTPAGSPYSVSDAFGAAMVGGGKALDIDRDLQAPGVGSGQTAARIALVVNVESSAAATANRQAIQAALDVGGSWLIDLPGKVWVNGPVYVGDNTSLVMRSDSVLKQVAGTNSLMFGTKSLLVTAVTVTPTWTAGKIASLAWTGHGLAVNDAVVLQGATQPEWHSIVRVITVTDANNVVVRLPFMPSASPTGTVTAVRCVRNVNIDVRLDYNFTNNAAAGQPNYARMGFVAGFIADSEVRVHAADVYKYALMVAGADDVRAWAFGDAPVRSDTAKLYGPLVNVTMTADGKGPEDCCSMQSLEPAAFIAYMPCRGAIRNCKYVDSAGAVTSSGSGAVVIYADDTYEQEGILIDGGEFRSSNAALPAVTIRSGAGFTGSSSKLRDVTLRNCGIESAILDALQVQTYINRLELDNVMFMPGGDTVGRRLVKIPSGGSVNQLVVSGFINTQSWPSATGYAFEVSSGGIADVLLFRNLTVRGPSTLRFLLLASGCTVRRVIFENCDFEGIDNLVRVEQAGVTVIVRGGRMSGLPTGANFRASGSFVVEGRPYVNNMNLGLVRSELAATVVDMYANGAPELAGTSVLFTSVTTGTVNIRSQDLTVDIGATGVNKVAGGRAFNTTARGTIPVNVPVISDGANWYNACNLAQTF